MATSIALDSVVGAGATALKMNAGSTAGETVEVLGYYAPNDGGGGTFYWEPSVTTGNDDAMIVVPTAPLNTGRWVRLYDSFVDIKWFGAKGDNFSNATPNIQATIDFATANGVDVFISEGIFVVTPPPASGSDILVVNLAATKKIDIYGAGASVSTIRYYPNGDYTNYNILKLEGAVVEVSSVHDFSIDAYNTIPKAGTALYVSNTSNMYFFNMRIYWMHTAIYLKDFISSSFKNIYADWGTYGVRTETSAPPNGRCPNLLNFTGCSINSFTKYGVEIIRGHVTQFTSCDFSGNGTQGDMTTGGIYYEFDGSNGASGLDVSSCYFEINMGGADIHLLPNGHGSHRIEGNLFNRLLSNQYTENNIVIEGNGQTPQPTFGFSKAKLVIQSNGFYSTSPYSPSASRATIELLNTNPDYWQYDIVEQGNVYSDIVDAPVFGLIEPTPGERYFRTPQISEYTRAKAFGAHFIVDNLNPEILPASYNVESITETAPGAFQVLFANELERMPVIVITCNNGTGEDTISYLSVAGIDYQNTTGFGFRIINFLPGGGSAQASSGFNFIVF